jgi:hypothetical protein
LATTAWICLHAVNWLGVLRFLAPMDAASGKSAATKVKGATNTATIGFAVLVHSGIERYGLYFISIAACVGITREKNISTPSTGPEQQI